jgi:hypothetical protein
MKDCHSAESVWDVLEPIRRENTLESFSQNRTEGSPWGQVGKTQKEALRKYGRTIFFSAPEHITIEWFTCNSLAEGSRKFLGAGPISRTVWPAMCFSDEPRQS